MLLSERGDFSLPSFWLGSLPKYYIKKANFEILYVLSWSKGYSMVKSSDEHRASFDYFFIRSKDSRDSFFKIMILASEHDRHYSIIIFLLTRGNFFIGIVPF